VGLPPTSGVSINANDIITYYKHLTNYKKANDINNDWMLLTKNNNKMTRNDFTYFVKSIFEPLGKNISTTMIRKIIVSNLYPVEQMKALAHTMGHDIGTAMEYYAKD
jgi:site-specific recombinase XerD